MAVEQQGVSVEREVHRFARYDVDLVFPYIILTLCLRGTARALYDMREVTHRPNDLAFIMPGHIMRPLECSEDYTYARLFVSSQLFSDLRMYTFSHDYDKFNYAPICTLTDEQAQRLLVFMEQLGVIAGHTDEELPHRYQALLAQLSVGYEMLNFYRREQDKQWAQSRHMDLFNRFCELVVEHYRESKEIQFYAAQLRLTPKYFSKSIRAAAGISPGEWIEQYVVTQAKRLIENYPHHTLKEIAFMLGFNEPSSFYRYFKHATGITAKQFRDSLKA